MEEEEDDKDHSCTDVGGFEELVEAVPVRVSKMLRSLLKELTE